VYGESLCLDMPSIIWWLP